MRRFASLLALLWSFSALGSVAARAQVDDFDVDLELVLAVDVSRSMDIDEQRLQREGYVAAFRHPDVIDAIRSGPLGKIAVTYFEWAGPGMRWLVVPWTVIASADDGEAFSVRLAGTPPARESGTSISSGLFYAAGQFGQAFSGYRRTIDVSGDGPNNDGRRVDQTRDWLVGRGVTINGLPIMLKRTFTFGPYGIPNLDVYYEDCVIGGPGAFMIKVDDPANFAEAIRRKLVLEIAGLPPRVIPAAEVARPPPRIDCQIGEKMRRNNMMLQDRLR